MLTIIKLVHTCIWMFFNAIIIYLFYATVSNNIGKWVFVCIGIILTEGLILLCFRGKCPLTLLAKRYGDSTKDNFDIWLPNWLAKYNKLIYTTLFAASVILLIWRLSTNGK
ncbi:MAG: hypothetical protein ABIQ88_01515 [Chitinophagaceae bacterium]